MSHVYTQNKRMLCPLYARGWSDFHRFGDSGASSDMPLSYYEGFADAATQDIPGEYMEDHSNH